MRPAALATLAVMVGMGCKLEPLPRCSSAAQCDYGESCVEGECAARGECPCQDDELCFSDGDLEDCVRADGTCETYQDCAHGSVCRDGWCSYRHASTPDTARRSFDEEVFGFADQKGPGDEIFDVDERIFLSWTPVEWLEADRTTIGLFEEPPVVATDRIVNADRTLRGSFSFQGNGSFRMRVREILGRSLGEPLDPGPYYWAVWQHRDGAIVAFSDVELFQVQESQMRLQLAGTRCRGHAECWAEDEQAVACIEGSCQVVCAGADADCRSGRCIREPSGPYWRCAER